MEPHSTLEIKDNKSVWLNNLPKEKKRKGSSCQCIQDGLIPMLFEHPCPISMNL